LFDQSQIEFFGYVLSADGVSPDLAKVQSLRGAERLPSAEEERSFLEMASYSGSFITNFSISSCPT